jgi:hypothetical protein
VTTVATGVMIWLRQALHAATLEAHDALELDASGTAIVRRLNRHDNRRLAGAAATGLAAAPLAAVSPTLVAAKMVPAVSEVWWRQTLL